MKVFSPLKSKRGGFFYFENYCIIPFSTVDKQKNPIYGVTKPFFGFLNFLKCCM